MISLLSLAISVSALPFAAKLDVPVEACNVFDSPYSCENSTAITSDSCCFERPGLLLVTQFWDYSPESADLVENKKRDCNITSPIAKPSLNPVEKSFTIHGLWSDYCATPDGGSAGWPEFCDPSLEVQPEDLEQLIGTTFNKPELLKTMQTYWINSADSNVDSDVDATLWAHEYNKHGTCMNTVRPSCFTENYQEGEAAVHFFEKVVDLWKGIKTYEALEKAGILPTTEKKYSIEDIKSALKKSFYGHEVSISCRGLYLNEIWNYYHVRGSVLTGDYKPVDMIGSDGCPDEIWYLPK